MKGCIYKLDGKLFNSELELNDFLLEKFPMKSVLGDLVFELTASQTAAAKLLEDMKKKTDKIDDIFKKGKRVSSIDRDSYNYKHPYIGVNKFLSTYKNEYGKRLHPEFDINEYWNHRYDDWKNGKFTEEEEELFGETTPITDETIRNQKRSQIESKWKAQCLFGDAIHSVFETYFKHLNDNLSDDDIVKELMDTVTFEDGKVKYSELVTEVKTKEILEQVKEFHKAAKIKYGEDALFYPEFKLMGDATVELENGAKTLIGKVDLLVIDKYGIPHIVDYKTSLKEYQKFDSAKQLAYKYQTAVYGRLLAKHGFNIDKTDYSIVPIKINGFERIGNDYKFDTINFEDNIFKDIDLTGDSFNRRLDEVIHLPYVVDLSTEELMTKVVQVMREWFPKYQQFKKYTDEEIREEIKSVGGFEKNPDTGLYTYKPPRSQSERVITGETEAELFEAVKRYKEYLPTQRKNVINQVIKALKQGMKTGTAEVAFPKSRTNNGVVASQTWFKNNMKKYCNDCWEVMEGGQYEALQHFGLICLHNKNTGQFDFVKISMQDHHYRHKFGIDRNTVGGNFASDNYFASQPDSLMLENAVGNIELMETMIVINNLQNIFGNSGIVGHIGVYNPVDGNGMTASNKQLYYNFNMLNKLSGNKVTDNFKNKDIHLATQAHIANTMLNDILANGTQEQWKGDYFRFKDFGSALSALDRVIDRTTDEKIKALKQVIKLLDEKGDTFNPDQDPTMAATNHRMVYQQALLALAELQGIDFRQQIDKHSKWLDTLAIHRKGVSGLAIDNPGNLSSETLNLITKLVTEAYQNVRSDIQRPIAETQDLVRELQKEKNFGWMTKNTYGNQADLYSNMYDMSNGDMKFKNPWKDSTLSPAERKFLKYALTRINKNRHPDLSDSKIQEMIDNDDVTYFRVPLAKGDTSSRTSQKGLMNAFKDELKGWTPSEAIKRAQDAAEGIFTDEQRARNKGELFKLANHFEYGEDTEERLDAIQRNGGPVYFETNLETLLLKHEFAYARAKRVNEVFPTIKAALIHLSLQGIMANNKFADDIEYAVDYIRNRIKNESIVNETNKPLEAIGNKLKSVTSKLALAFSPVQMIYQNVQGLWQDISLIIRKPDGTDAFTIKNFAKALKLVYKTLGNFSDKPNVIEALNRLYGINDMDMNTYIDKIKTDQHGIFNLTNLMFKFASRPDFYNRMSIFTAKMLADGSYDAHTVDEKGMLVYDWTKDKRFEQFAKGNTSHPDYQKQAALYAAVGRQFELENALVEVNGEMVPFKLNMKKPMDLPRAYTNKDAESMKALGDTIYGYYSHEKKSLMNSYLVGSMWMQFKTYWSSKKNQYLQKGGVKLEGKWVPYQENGQQYYYQVDEDGTVRFDLEPVLTNTGVPVYRWEGDWKEGILLTVFDLANNMIHDGIVDGWKSKWYAEDPKMKTTYRSNIIQLGYDIAMLAIVGTLITGALMDWYDEEEKESKDDDSLLTGARLAFLNICIMSLRNSALDFNFIDSVSSPVTQWTPFAFEQISSQAQNVYKLALGEQDIFDTMARATSVGRQFRPFSDRVDIALFGDDE